MDLSAIVRVAIHPSIGIARVGNSADEFFIGPEVVDPPPKPPGFYRDKTGALKREAARFRLYGLDKDDKVVAELTPENSEIEWTVHLANKKAAWYQFQLALDIPEAASAPPALLRNPSTADRSKLAIDPGPRKIAGRNASGPQYRFDTGRFFDKPVYLGEVRTDEAGHLVVLGGHGKSASHLGLQAVTFANNDGWHDDVSDGPVTATVKIPGRTLAATPSWVVVTPPNYGPLQKSVRTMWDLMRDLAITNKFGLKAPAKPSFANDILPIFLRLSRLQWVNEGFAATFGWGNPNNFETDAMIARLGSTAEMNKDFRQNLFLQFRNFDRDAWSPVPWPWNYGDAMNVPTPKTPRAFTALTDLQLAMLKQWASGDFDSDYDPKKVPPPTIDDVPLQDQPTMLDRASLEFCLADAFHPGCEMTWPVREPTMYMAPFRFLHAPPGWIEPSYGAQISPDMAAPPFAGDPFAAQVPGGLSRWMAVPWQTDTASCQSGYTPDYDPYLPTFWPARVPNQALRLQDYETVMNTKLPLETRMAAFAKRADWLAIVKNAHLTDYVGQINDFAANISQVSVVETREGIPGDPHFPPVMQVEDIDQPELGAAEPNKAKIQKVKRFPHGLK
jgi:hypothetical protein